MTGLGLRDGRQHRDRASFFDDLISKSNALRIVLLEPLVGKLWRCEYLEMGRRRQLPCWCRHRSKQLSLVPLERPPPQVCEELHKIGTISALFRGMRKLGIIITALVVLSATVRGHPHFVLRVRPETSSRIT
jgi:hypothetical protein